MKTSKYYRARLVIIPGISLCVFISIYLGYPLLAIASILFGKILITFLKSQLKEKLEDEREQDVHEKAARTAFKILMPILGLTSLTLYFVGNGPFYFLKSLGIILGYVTCVGLGVYLTSYYYFNRKYGG